MNRNQKQRQNWREYRKHRNHKPSKSPVKKINHPVCCLCGNTIKDVYSAIAAGEDKKPAHFDCVVIELKKQENLGPGEQICYLGNGSFGVVQFRSNSSVLPFFIKKRIQYEKRDEAILWRKEFSLQLKK